MEQFAVTTQQASSIAQQAVKAEAQSASQVSASQILGELQQMSADNPSLSAAQALNILQGQFGSAAQSSAAATQASPSQQ